MRIESKLLLVIIWVALLPHPFVAQASGPQYRESNLEFVRSLTARLNVAETHATELEAQVKDVSTEQTTRNAYQMEEATAPNSAKTIAAGASAEPPEDDGAYTRVPERLRHKQRTVDVNPDAFGRIKLKFPLLREDIDKARKNLLSHELTHVAQSGKGNVVRPELMEIKTSIIEIETELANLAAEVAAAKKGQSGRH